MSLFRPIHHTFAPLGTRELRGDALRMSYAVHRYVRGNSTFLLKEELQKIFGAPASLFSGGREALLALLTSLNVKPGDEVILQGYTCVVVPNAIQAAGLAPVYVDIEQETLNLSVSAVAKAITHKTRAIICQHTFGIPADTKALRDLCDAHGIFFIEDCAHVLPDDKGPLEIGKYGDALIFSFGRDKAISGVAGGAVLCRNAHIASVIKAKEIAAKDLSWWTVMRFLEYPQIYAFCRPLYGIGIGKFLLAGFGKLKMLVPILSSDEKQSHMTNILHRMPNACAFLAVRQLRKLRAINDHRRALTAFYRTHLADPRFRIPNGIRDDLPLQKFPVFVSGASRMRSMLKKQNIYLEDGWTGCVVCPSNIQIDETGYKKGLDPKAESVCEEILNLPTHPGTSLADADFLIQSLGKIV